MIHHWGFQGKPNLAFIIFLGIAIWAKGETKDFTRLDSTFRAGIDGGSTLKELESVLLEMRTTAQDPIERGISQLHQGAFHFRCSKPGLALIACQKSVEILEYFKAPALVAEALLLEADIYHTLGKFGELRQIINRLAKSPPETIGVRNRNKLFRMQAGLCLNSGKIDSAHFYLQQGIEHALESGDTVGHIRAIYMDALVYQLSGNREMALRIMQKIKPKVHSTPNYIFQCDYYGFLGMVYLSVDQHDEAIAAYEKAVYTSRRRELPSKEGTALNNLAFGLKIAGDTANAIVRFDEALKIGVELDRSTLIASTCTGLADIHIGKKNWELAQKYAQKGLVYSRMAEKVRMEAYALMRLATIDIEFGNYLAALEALALADSLTRLMGNWARISDIYTLRSEASEKMGDMDQALYFQRMANSARDSVMYTDARLYADSLKLRQMELASAKLPEAHPWPSLVFALVLIGLVWLIIWKYRPNSHQVQSARPRKEEEGLQAEKVQQAIASLKDSRDWTGFMLQFDAIYPGLMETIAQRHPGITPTDMRVLALARLGLSADEAGELLGISTESAKKARYRARKRLGISSEQSLLQYMLQR